MLSAATGPGAWLFYILIGLWIRLAVAVSLGAGGVAMIAALPLALLQRAGFIPEVVTVQLGGRDWLAAQGDGVYYLVAVSCFLAGIICLIVLFGPAQRWLQRRPVQA